MTGQNILDLAGVHVGERYVLGTLVPKNNAAYKGPWDCAEFASWLVYQKSQKLYGCANDAGDPGSSDGYTGFWKRDVQNLGNAIPVELAARTPGAFILRYSGSGITGHIIISDGKGGTVEAHSHKDGVIRSVVSGRRWDIGILVPWIDYTFSNREVTVYKPSGVIYRFTDPLMRSEKIKEIQTFLKIQADGIFGSKTFNAVKQFQNEKGLVPDGEVGKLTAAAMGINL